MLQKMFSCGNCDKDFAQSQLLKIHESIHVRGKDILATIVTKILNKKVRYVDEILFYH